MPKRRKHIAIDPYSRIIVTFEDGEVVRVFFDLPRELFDTLVDISSFHNFDLDETIAAAIETYAQRIFGGEGIQEVITTKESDELGSVKETLDKLTGMINELASKFSQIATSGGAVAVVPRETKARINLNSIEEIPELEEISGSEASAEEERASIDDVLEDVLVVAFDEDVISDTDEDSHKKDKEREN